MPIEQTEVLISTPDGQMPAVLFTPTHPDRQSAILLLMEAFGLTSHIQDVAARIAHEGYVVIIPAFLTSLKCRGAEGKEQG
ncbi:dienelactone hydrolase family protein, partial [uncultured Nostoc sp.]|uniref:dienelactone hydrolase family protein n=1 Tax=uncultured Nostoc sp. TaxID=340711 RepID=UPI0035CA2EA1